MKHTLVTLIGKAVLAVAKLRGGGSALPGLIVERLDPAYLKTALADLAYGVVVVSGTNGKTTTTKIITELLRGQGLRVFTNPTGSNFERGVISAVLGESGARGRVPADIAVLELDEAHAVRFVGHVAPRYTVLLNVMRDQMDRFGEIDHTADLLAAVANRTSTALIVNRGDRRLRGIASKANPGVAVHYFGVSQEFGDTFVEDDQLHGGDGRAHEALPAADAELVAVAGNQVGFLVDGHRLDVAMRLSGLYNFANAAAAIALVEAALGTALDIDALAASLAEVEPAFGRGERLDYAGRPLEFILVKNPGGFRLALKTPVGVDWTTVIAINDDYADGRDVSWLWDVDFASLRSGGVDIVAGTRATEMALRLFYDEVPVGRIEPDLVAALTAAAEIGKPIRIFTTYTAMLALRRIARNGSARGGVTA